MLLVSGDQSLLRQLTRFLELFGYEVRQAIDGQQAISAAEVAGADFLLVDGDLTPKPGLAFSRTIRSFAPGGYTFAALLVDPLESADLTEALEAGFDDFLAKPVVFGELLARLRAGARVIEFERRLTQQAGIEPVTGLPDSNILAVAIKDHLSSARDRGKQETVGSLCVIDLDYFSRFGARFGREGAEGLLRRTAELLSQACQPGEFAASLGKDRFAVLFPNATEEQTALWARSFLDSIAHREHAVGEAKVHLTGSCGVVEFSRSLTAERSLEIAEQVLNLAKSSGRNHVLTQQVWEKDVEAWNKFAAGGKLFSTTLARDVMVPCGVFLCIDDTVEQGQAILEQTRLSAIPVVDREGKFAGLVTATQLKGKASRPAKTRASGSVRLLRHHMTTDVPKFNELSTLGELMEFFTAEHSSVAVILRDQRPAGLVYCQSLAALNEKLVREHFIPSLPFSSTSEYLLVPDLTTADTE
ncbi:MAG: diguanylate cyclase [Planctomycetales bacterium]|nr:diguanylate cyclase [Planctomycetales bacterium]